MSSMWEMARSLWPFGEEDASVFKFGAKMAGQEKYLGGEVGPDGCIYSIPGHATRVPRQCRVLFFRRVRVACVCVMDL